MRGRVRVSKRAAGARRRGVLLLVVLSLLVLFALIGVTYVVVAGQYRRASVATVRAEIRVDDYQRQLDDAVYQVFRGSRNPLSPLFDQSLLEDMYGGDSVTGTLTSVPIKAGGNVSQLLDVPIGVASSATPLSVLNGFYNGCVFTMLNGPARGHSARIVGYDSTQKALRIMVSDDFPATQFTDATAFNAYPNPPGHVYLINGRAFNGTGFGYNPTSGRLDLTDTGSPAQKFALMINHKFSSPTNAIGALAADEDYDAPDPQNAFLAYMPADATEAKQIIPSFHRPDLIAFLKQTNGGTLSPDLTLKSSFRPTDSTFTGSNPNFVADLNATPSGTAGFWDIDNDGDGITDSVWIDCGFPVMTAKDGRQYKRLYAFLCLDLDGRMNVNAHGSPAQLEQTFTANPPNNYYFAKSGVAPDNQLSLSRGLGVGPAEVNLQNLFPPANAAQQYMALMAGNASLGYEGRYGERSRVPATLPSYYPVNDNTNAASLLPLAGKTGTDQQMALVRFFEMPPYDAATTMLSSYSMPGDLWGRGFIGIDPFGMPLTPGMGGPWDVRNSPYDLDLSHKAVRSSTIANGVDNPFTAAELERLLRRNDIDGNSLPGRLLALVDPTNSNNPGLRRAVTTDSFDLPSPGVVPVRNDGTAQAYPHSAVVDLLAQRLTANGITGAAANTQIQNMLSLDLLAGLRFDINRPIGNGRDDNNNGIVDEPGETTTSNQAEKVWQSPPNAYATLPGGFANIYFDHNDDGTSNYNTAFQKDQLARQLLARNLYVLAMLLKPNNVNIDFNGNTADDSAAETARGLAQWAVNVVDFRDRDSIMTGFEYDINPFNGWDADGDLTMQEAEADVVWGCERPELLITETLATHERRTEDLNTDPSGKKTTDMPTPDPHFDQRLRPRSSLFVELYNPWTGGEGESGEFYHDGTNMQNGVLLAKKSAVGNTPIWRLLIVRRSGNPPYNAVVNPLDPDSPVAAQRPTAANMERAVYFTNPNGTVTDAVQLAFYPSNALVNRIAPLLPGRYAVVGSSNQPGAGSSFVTAFGRRSGAADGTDPSSNNTQRIVLKPNVNPANTTQVQVLDDTFVPSTSNSSPPIAIAIDQPRSLSITDPLAGYSDTPGTSTWDSAAAGGEGAYSPPLDEPLDKTRAVADPRLAVLMQNTTAWDYCTVHLQRLANPLLGWNAQTNPYRTIDTAGVDLTVYNGVTTDTHASELSGSTGFATHQRGDQDSPNAGVAGPRNLWKQDFTAVARTSQADANHVFAFQLKHSLGYINIPYGPAYGDTSGSTPPATNYTGAPNTTNPNSPPFPWLCWNNRPYISPMELLLVPKSQSSRLLRDFTISSGAVNYSAPASPYGHLLNFYYSDPSNTPTATTPNLARLFEYLHVPSPFVGTETILNPQVFQGNVAGTETFHPPFNRVSNYRDPGRINLNTINSQVTYEALFGANGNTSGSNTRHPGPSWARFVASRAGSATPYNTAFPSSFGNPFRSAAGAVLGLPGLPAPHNNRQESQVTLLRPSLPDLSGAPLFDFPSNDADPSVSGVNGYSSYNDPTRSAYFRYQELARLNNLVTTRSNVYAIWVTVGYFEVKPVAVDQGHPDGYQLGQELGIDTGEVQRHRGFYIFDRTIPVGFQRGDDFNTDKAVLLKRFIE